MRRALPTGRIEKGSLDETIETLAGELEQIASPEVMTSFIAGEDGLRGDFHGYDGYREGLRDWLQTFQWLESEVQEVKETPGVIVIMTHQRGASTQGGMPLDKPSAAVVFWKDDKVSRLEFHLDQTSALKSAGLESWAPRAEMPLILHLPASQIG